MLQSIPDPAETFLLPLQSGLRPFCGFIAKGWEATGRLKPYKSHSLSENGF